MNFNDAELAVLASDVHNIAIFFRLDVLPSPVRLWMGFGNIDPGPNTYDPSGAIYQGFGELRDFPAIVQLLNGTADRVDFTLSGVADEVLAVATGDDSSAIKGRLVAIGFGIFDTNWSLLGSVHWTGVYVADYLSGAQSVAEASSESINRTITLSCGTRFTGRRRPSSAYWSNQDQQARFSGDLFCSLVTNYAHGYNKTWPVF